MHVLHASTYFTFRSTFRAKRTNSAYLVYSLPVREAEEAATKMSEGMTDLLCEMRYFCFQRRVDEYRIMKTQKNISTVWMPTNAEQHISYFFSKS